MNSEPVLWLILLVLTAIWPTSSGNWSEWVMVLLGMRLGWVGCEWLGRHSEL